MDAFRRKVPISCPILTKTGMFRQILVKLLSIKFNENPFNGSRVHGLTDTDRQAW